MLAALAMVAGRRGARGRSLRRRSCTTWRGLDGTARSWASPRAGNRFRAYLSDGDAETRDAVGLVQGRLGPDGQLTTTSYDIELAAHLERGRDTGP